MGDIDFDSKLIVPLLLVMVRQSLAAAVVLR